MRQTKNISANFTSEANGMKLERIDDEDGAVSRETIETSSRLECDQQTRHSDEDKKRTAWYRQMYRELYSSSLEGNNGEKSVGYYDCRYF